MEPNVVEIAPPVTSHSRTQTPNKTPEVIDVEEYEGGVHNNNNVDHKNKGKAIEVDDEQVAGSANGTMDNNDDYYPGSSPISNSLLDPDSLIYEDDYEYPDEDGYEEEEEEEDGDEYSIYQDLFDSKDLPTGVELSMDFFPDSDGKEKGSKSTNGNNKSYGTSSSSSSKKATKEADGIHLHSKYFYLEKHPTPVAQPWTLPPKSGVTPSNAYPLPKSYAPPLTIGSSPSNTLFANNLQPQTPGEAPAPAPAPSGVLLSVPPNKPSFYPGYRGEEPILPPDPSRVKRNMDEYLGKYLFFKRFDIVEDFSDHHFASKGTTSKQHSKEWVRRIQEEWKILEHDLPEMIFVRVYESRMDLLRAVIIGADGTPYHDGLFFFDIFFPDTYPSVPPNVHYQSGGLRINPNLYNCGKVCLSLLGTWTGTGSQRWIPNDSTMLQVLVSIQGLILNKKPYFNEPGYESSAGTLSGEASSKVYSENTLMLSLKTMVYSMRRPPMHFEAFSYGHFFSCAHDVLKACKAYTNGAPVASLVRGNVKEGEKSTETCSQRLRADVANFVETVLLKEFILLGVLGLEVEPEDKPTQTNNVEESSTTTTRSRSKRDRVSSN